MLILNLTGDTEIPERGWYLCVTGQVLINERGEPLHSESTVVYFI